jgi:hypothetical protein
MVHFSSRRPRGEPVVERAPPWCIFPERKNTLKNDFDFDFDCDALRLPFIEIEIEIEIVFCSRAHFHLRRLYDGMSTPKRLDFSDGPDPPPSAAFGMASGVALEA